jgi:hypothetical protein
VVKEKSMDTNTFSPKAYYSEQWSKADEGLSICKKEINQLALARLLVLIGGAAGMFWVVQQKQLWAVLALFFGLIILFFYLVQKQSKAEKRKQYWLDLRWVNQNELDLLDGKESAYSDGKEFADGSHPYADDLDVLGPKSLYALFNRASTTRGQRILAEWMLSTDALEEVKARQEAVKEMIPAYTWSQQFQTALVSHVHRKQDVTPILKQLLEPQRFSIGWGFLRKYVPLAPFIVLALGVLGWWWTPAWGWMMVVLLLHLMLALAVTGKVNQISYGVDRIGKVLSTFAEAILLIEQQTWKSPWMQKWSSRLTLDTQGKTVSKAFSELGHLLQQLDVRLNLLVGQVLNMVMLWDFKQVFALQTWRKQYGEAVMEGIEVLAQVEAMDSLATGARNHPHWTFPQCVGESRPLLLAKAMDHPLIPEHISVSNDYDHRVHQVSLITGSNMAGKSTFLRTIGANVVLAFSGTKVAAQDMQVSEMHMLTYMRIKDSLQEQTSTFKAELNRMQYILHEVERDPKAFFLIDEMLRGTNSVDKYLGSKAIILKLLALQGKGVVATHDLQLAELAHQHASIQNYHFDIQVQQDEMLFDYKLKEGPCTIFNASLLLKGIGIDVMPEKDEK